VPDGIEKLSRSGKIQKVLGALVAGLVAENHQIMRDRELSGHASIRHLLRTPRGDNWRKAIPE
jgi:hypothetical protein